MSEAREKIPEVVTRGLQGSGFPFQTAITYVIGSTGWRVHASEYPWQGRGDENCFLDVVATNGNFFLMVECKKTRKETFTFLLPLGRLNTGDVPDFRCLRTDFQVSAPGGISAFCENWALWPMSPCSEFCVVTTSKSGGDQRLLERDASLVVGGTDAFAQDVGAWWRVKSKQESPRLFLPVIVTNAKIYTARYKPSEVSLETGEFQELPKEIKEAPWVRFSKAFTAARGRDLGHRSVFVVNATFLGEFLENLEMAPSQPEDQMSVPIPLRPPVV